MILVTGGAGYIGSHCAINLIENGYDVVLFDNLELGHIEIVESIKNISSNVVFVKGDLRNFDEINSVFKNFKIDAVIHFAAYSIVEESVAEPQKYYDNNVYGSLNLFKAMIENNVKKVVFSSSCSVFGEPEYIPLDELHPKKPVNPYGYTKLTVENILADYDITHSLKSVILRYFNVIGADRLLRTGEWHDNETHLLPNIIKSALNNSVDFKIYGNDYPTKDGTCIRDYVNVEDLANAHTLALKFLENNDKSEDFNLGTGCSDTVLDIFNAVEKTAGKKLNFVFTKRRPGDTVQLCANNSKARKILGWKHQKTLQDSVQAALNWENVLQTKLLIR